jgi:AraC family transcriptional regulator of adaptative response/methylated-DNA-[protein]-cysteine methyltransferase
MMDELTEKSQDYQRIEAAITFLEENFQQQPDLEVMAASVHLSKYHFQRLFKRWAGVTPTQFLHYLTVDYAKERLRESRSVLDATLDAGLSSPGRLHDLFVSYQAMTPGEYKRQGVGLVLQYGFHPTPFGECLLALTPRGICALRFLVGDDRQSALHQLQSEWPRAQFIGDTDSTGKVVERLFTGASPEGDPRLHLVLKGTNFQVQVWQALLKIPVGAMVSYQGVAAMIGNPNASRAVAHAIARNPVGYLIPCHRVINKSGQIHAYRWGSARKKAILGWEASRREATIGS